MARFGRPHAMVSLGLIFIAQTFTALAPSGPWNSSSFTSGVIGLLGLFMVYAGWFALTFQRWGLLPTIDMWKSPQTTWKQVFWFGLVCIGLNALLPALGHRFDMPEPAGLLLLLIGGLAMLNSIYVWSITVGPLRHEVAIHSIEEA